MVPIIFILRFCSFADSWALGSYFQCEGKEERIKMTFCLQQCFLPSYLKAEVSDGGSDSVVWPFCREGQCSVIMQSRPCIHLPISLSFLLRIVGTLIILPLHTNLLSAHTFVRCNAHTHTHTYKMWTQVKE